MKNAVSSFYLFPRSIIILLRFDDLNISMSWQISIFYVEVRMNGLHTNM